jgi:hypothetical protein
MLDWLKGPEGKGFGAIILRVPEPTISTAGALYQPRSVVADMTAAAGVRAMAHQVRHHRRHRAWGPDLVYAHRRHKLQHRLRSRAS